MDHYKSWSGLNKWLNECLCEELKGRITYFLTRYHKVHDSYGRAATCCSCRYCSTHEKHTSSLPSSKIAALP